MTLRQVLVQAGLAVSALVVAYFTWQRAPELAADEAIALDIGKNDLVAARFDDPDKHTWVELTRSSDEQGPFISVRLAPQDKPSPAKPAAHGKPDQQDKDKKAQPDPAATSKTPERLVRGSEAAEKLLAGLAPLRATRSLGVLGKDKLKELGLDATKKHLTLTLRGGQRAFAIAPAPPGGTMPYLLDQATGRVYLVNRSLLSDFETAGSLLVERKLHGFRIEEADRVQVTLGDARREIVVSRGDDQIRFALASNPKQPEATLKTWNDRLFSLWPADVLGKGEAPAEGAPQPALRLAYTAHGRGLGYLEIGKVAALASSPEGAKDTLYARSERTLGWVKLGADAQNVLADVPAGLK